MGRNVTKERSAHEALRESEARFKNLLEHIPGVSIQGYSPDGTVKYWNKASKEVYGWTAEEALGRNLGELIIPDDLLPLFRECLLLGEAATRSGELTPPGELTLKRKDGSPVDVYSIHTVVCMDGCEPLMFCIDVDLSERKRAEEQVRGYVKELAAKNAELLDFAYTVSHDLRTPVLTMVNYLSILKEENLVRDDGVEIADRLIQQGKGMLQFITRLLDISRAGNVIGERENVRLGELFRKAFADLKPPEVKARLVIRGDLPEVSSDATRLRQVVENLVGNAIHFRDTAKKSLVIEVCAMSRKGEHLVEIRDNGVGIAATNLQKIFRPGYSEKGAEMGEAGFGLPIAKKIVEAHGGRLWASSGGKGKGATFSFTLPV